MNTFLLIILFILIMHFVLELIIDYLNIKNISPTIPEGFTKFYNAKKYAQSQSYLKAKTHIHILQALLSTVVMVILIVTGTFNTIDLWCRQFDLGSIQTGLIFCAVLALGVFLLDLPFSIYRTFVIEEKFNFNRITPKTYCLDIVKATILTALLGSGLLSGIFWFFESAGSMAWVYSWVALTSFQIIISYLAPIVIMPLFNKFIPLPEGELRSAIETYVKEQNFALSGIYTMDGSKRSNKSNAFFTGFGKHRRIVLFDTLVEKFDTNELLAILAHEMGHCKKKHILKTFALSIFNTGLTLFLLSLFINNIALFEAFGMTNLSIYASLFFFGIIYSPVQMLLSLSSQSLSRKHEYEADHYAVTTVKEPLAFPVALKKLSIDHLTNLQPHYLKVIFEYSHPPTIQRLNAINAAIPANKKEEAALSL